MINENYDSPDDIAHVELRIQAVSGNNAPVIYANGRNQCPVEVIAKASKKDSNGEDVLLTFSDETWIQILNLRHAESDEKLSRSGTSGWCFTNTKNEYSKEILSTALLSENDSEKEHVLDAGQKLITFYVYTDDINLKRIAVSLDTDGGKHFTTSDNADGVEKDSVSISAIQNLSYHNGNNIEIINDDPVVLSDQMHYTSRIMATSYQHENGIAKRTIFRFKSAKQHLFLNHSVTYDPIHYNDCNTGWDEHFEIGGMNAFSNESGYGKPCAVIGEARDGGYNAYVWYSRKNIIGFGAGWLSDRWEAGRYYKCRFLNTSLPDENHLGDDENGEVTLLLYTFICHEHNDKNMWWNNVRRTPDVYVIDSYGNEGTFQVTFNNDSVGFV